MSDTLSCAQSGPAGASTRDRILALLREAASGTGEGWRSGEEISALLGLSRAAVSKHVRTKGASSSRAGSLRARAARAAPGFPRPAVWRLRLFCDPPARARRR